MFKGKEVTLSCPVIVLHFSKGKGLDMANKYVYSESFKHHVVSEFEAGKFSSFNEARKAYGIGGGTTVARWVEQYGKTHLLSRTITVMKADEKSEVKKLRKRVKELERALSDSRIEVLIEKEYVKIFCEEHNEDPNKYKKKLGVL